MKNQNRMTQGDGIGRNRGKALSRGTAAVSEAVLMTATEARRNV